MAFGQHQEQPPALREPLVVEPPQHRHRVVDVLEDMREYDVVVAAGDEALSIVAFTKVVLPPDGPRVLDRRGGGLDAGHVVEVAEQSPREVSPPAPELEKTALREEWKEGAQHERVHHIDVKTIGIPALILRRATLI